jgi:hypothetical protein
LSLGFVDGVGGVELDGGVYVPVVVKLGEVSMLLGVNVVEVGSKESEVDSPPQVATQ